MLSCTLHTACTGINWHLRALAGGCFFADWLLTTSQARQILRGHIIWRSVSLADNSIVARRPGGKDQPCYASSLAGVSRLAVGMRESASSSAVRLYLVVNLRMADDSSETTWRLPEKRYLNSPNSSKKERKHDWGRRASVWPQLHGQDWSLGWGLWGCYALPREIWTQLALCRNLHHGILTFVLQIVYFGLDGVWLCLSVS